MLYRLDLYPIKLKSAVHKRALEHLLKYNLILTYFITFEDYCHFERKS